MVVTLGQMRLKALHNVQVPASEARQAVRRLAQALGLTTGLQFCQQQLDQRGKGRAGGCGSIRSAVFADRL